MTQIGLYIPYNGSLFGCQVLNYLNGCVVSCDTNMYMKVERKHSATNEYFGVVKTIESSETKVEVK